MTNDIEEKEEGLVLDCIEQLGITLLDVFSFPCVIIGNYSRNICRQIIAKHCIPICFSICQTTDHSIDRWNSTKVWRQRATTRGNYTTHWHGGRPAEEAETGEHSYNRMHWAHRIFCSIWQSHSVILYEII